jgi:hypothetical protein
MSQSHDAHFKKIIKKQNFDVALKINKIVN